MSFTLTSIGRLILLTICLLHLVCATKYCEDRHGSLKKCESGSCCSSDESGCCKIGASLWYTWLLIIVFAVFMCVCIGCCRRCYCRQQSYSTRQTDAITLPDSTGSSPEPVVEEETSTYKDHFDAPPSYFDINPTPDEQEDLPPPYPGQNNT